MDNSKKNMENEEELTKTELGKLKNEGEDGYFIDDFEDGVNIEDGSICKYSPVDLNKAFEDEYVQKNLMDIIIKILDMISKIDTDKIEYLFNVLHDNLAMVKQNEDVKKGRVTPAKKEVSDIDIEMDYTDGLSCKKISEKYGMSEDGVRKRLKKLGVFKRAIKNN